MRALLLPVCSVLFASALTTSCGKGLSQRDDERKKEIEALRNDVAARDVQLTNTNADLEAAKKSLADKDASLAATKADADNKTASIEIEKAKAAAADARVDALRARYARHEAEVDELAKELAEREAALKTAAANNTELAAKAAELNSALEAAKSEREKTASELAAAIATRESIEKSLGDEKRVSLQVFLENSGPDTMFGAAGADVAPVFPRRGEDCAVVLDLDPEVKILGANERADTPDLHGYNALSMRASYRKVAVCRDGEKLEAQVEAGHIYRTISQSDERALISARVSSSCDKTPSDVQSSAVLGDSRFLMLRPFRGEMDGIETIDMPANDKTLRLHMGSALVGAATCAQALKTPNSNDLIVVACSVAVGQPIVGVSVAKGCFSKKTSWGRESTRFTAE